MERHIRSFQIIKTKELYSQTIKSLPGKAPHVQGRLGFLLASIIIFCSCLMRALPLNLNLLHVSSCSASSSAKNKVNSSTNTSVLTCFLSVPVTGLHNRVPCWAVCNEVLNQVTLADMRRSRLHCVCVHQGQRLQSTCVPSREQTLLWPEALPGDLPRLRGRRHMAKLTIPEWGLQGQSHGPGRQQAWLRYVVPPLMVTPGNPAKPEPKVRHSQEER